MDSQAGLGCAIPTLMALGFERLVQGSGRVLRPLQKETSNSRLRVEGTGIEHGVRKQGSWMP